MSMSELPYHYGLKVRLYPNYMQKKLIKINSDTFRFVYNQMIRINQKLLDLYYYKKIKLKSGKEKKILIPKPLKDNEARIKELKARLTPKGLMNHFWFIDSKRNKLIDSLSIANAKQNYQKAWQMFKKVHNSGTPKFHKKSYAEKYQTNAQYSSSLSYQGLDNGSVKFINFSKIKVPKLGNIRLKGSNKHLKKLLSNNRLTRIGTVTITKDNTGNYYLSLQLASSKPFVKLFQKTICSKVADNKKLGIDLNTENFLTDNNGNTISNPRYYRKMLNRLKKQQRKLSLRQIRAKKAKNKLIDAKNYQKQRKLVAKLATKVKNQRTNFLHVFSTALIKNHDLVVAEELRSKNMLRNHALAMSITDVGWRTFLQMLAYKANLYGSKFITVSPRNTTQMCHDCKFVMGINNSKKLTLQDRRWTCPNCDSFHVRDVNAAKNILTKGLQSELG